MRTYWDLLCKSMYCQHSIIHEAINNIIWIASPLLVVDDVTSKLIGQLAVSRLYDVIV